MATSQPLALKSYILPTLWPLLSTLAAAFIFSSVNVLFRTNAVLANQQRLLALAMTCIFAFVQTPLIAQAYANRPTEQRIAVHGSAMVCLTTFAVFCVIAGSILVGGAVALGMCVLHYKAFANQTYIIRLVLRWQLIAIVLGIIFLLPEVIGFY